MIDFILFLLIFKNYFHLLKFIKFVKKYKFLLELNSIKKF